MCDLISEYHGGFRFFGYWSDKLMTEDEYDEYIKTLKKVK